MLNVRDFNKMNGAEFLEKYPEYEGFYIELYRVVRDLEWRKYDKFTWYLYRSNQGFLTAKRYRNKEHRFFSSGDIIYKTITIHDLIK